MRYHNSQVATWTVVPINAPLVVRNCNKCGTKKEFYCSEKFRMNGRHTKIDIWLIYKCTKCDTTWKLTIKKGIKPHDISAEMFYLFTINDKDLAWRYAFDRSLLKQNGCDVVYEKVEYRVDGFDTVDLTNPLYLQIKSIYLFELKLASLLARMLGLSTSKLKKLVSDGTIRTSPECKIMKYRIRADLEVILCFQ